MSYEIPQIAFAGAADPASIIKKGQARFTILTSRMIRMEYDDTGNFEDRPSQAIWFRKQPVPSIRTNHQENVLEIDTGVLTLKYKDTPQGFSPDTLSIAFNEKDTIWRYGDRDNQNLKGTGRTLDNANGAIPLENGLLSRAGWSLVDDSQSLVFNDQGWLELRQTHILHPETLDLYFLGYGNDYLGCLNDFCKIAGNVPLVPRWILGNWWSRYWEYSQEELTDLMKEFHKREIPLSVCIVDMDWHITNTGNSSSGWTGYTWNKNLFPCPYEFIEWLHQNGLRTALNLHPAEGIHPHEETYQQMAKFMGIDPSSQQPVAFDIADPHFTKGYFEILHHPMEAKGVDFWWMDWQQGVRVRHSKNEIAQVMDPLWWLNHLHYYDQKRNGTKRGFIFSRWGGLGNHRYPIGFSGDSIVTWESLAFQPYFTSTASNVAFGWWSHDIGGHYKGIEDAELFTRWVQFGVFSPILRIHCTKNFYQDRRPWNYDEQTLTILRDYLQLRHSLIPYLYSMAYRFTNETIPPITPMYYHHPNDEDSYHCPNQYYFGSELLVAPYTSPLDPQIRMSRQIIWLPKGNWYNFFTGQKYCGNRWITQYGTMDEIPVFAHAGAIIPLAPRTGWGGLDIPQQLDIQLFTGDNGAFNLYEDDGETTSYQSGKSCITRFSQTWDESSMSFQINPPEGETSLLPECRDIQVSLWGIRQPDLIEGFIDQKPCKLPVQYDPILEKLTIPTIHLGRQSKLEIKISTKSSSLSQNRDRREENLVRSLQRFRLDSDHKVQIHTAIPDLLKNNSHLDFYADWLSTSQIAVLGEILREIN